MGMSTDALLWYGYCWSDEARLVPEDDDGDSDWEATYVAKKGLTRGGEDFDIWHQKKKALLDAAGVLIDSHCSSDYPLPLIAISSTMFRAYRGHAKPIPLLAVDSKWDGMLEEFCNVMGITPPVGQIPKWWLASDLG